MNVNEVVIGAVETPVGRFGAVLSPGGVCRLTFPTEPLAMCEAWVDRWMPDATRVRTSAGLSQLADDLNAYLTGQAAGFQSPVDLRGTPFQVQVWTALRQIGYGEVRSYSQIAEAIGRPRAVRAVGAANGANPVPILVPCHRVIGRDGTLVGYAGGLDLKRRLLAIEGRGADG